MEDEEYVGFEASRAFKRQLREQEIDSGLKEKLRVDRHRLNSILNILHFYCVWDSSVYRDQAIKGSDIDGGVIVVDKRDREKENALIEELVRQGFSTCHADLCGTSKGIQFITQSEFDKIDWKMRSANLDTSKEVGIYRD